MGAADSLIGDGLAQSPYAEAVADRNNVARIAHILSEQLIVADKRSEKYKSERDRLDVLLKECIASDEYHVAEREKWKAEAELRRERKIRCEELERENDALRAERLQGGHRSPRTEETMPLEKIWRHHDLC
jgi:hypothetical protein